MVMKYADNIVKVRLGFMTVLWYFYHLIASIEFETFMSLIKILGFFFLFEIAHMIKHTTSKITFYYLFVHMIHFLLYVSGFYGNTYWIYI